MKLGRAWLGPLVAGLAVCLSACNPLDHGPTTYQGQSPATTQPAVAAPAPATTSAHPSAPHWTLTVTGTASTADIVYQLDGNSQNEADSSQSQNLKLPWTKTVDGYVNAGDFAAGRGVTIGDHNYDTVRISAMPSNAGTGTLTCKITNADTGRVMDQEKATFTSDTAGNELRCDAQSLID